MVEICCGSYYDALQAESGGARRIELNSALHLGGLTPSLAVLQLVKQETALEVAAMIRVRGGGFCYNREDFQVMLSECEMIMKHGADCAVFGCLDQNLEIDTDKNRQLIEITKAYKGEVVFHRAFDCVADPYKAMETLIELGVDRVLTSGLKPKAPEGAELLKELQQRYGQDIEILAGSGVNSTNARTLMEYTGITQVHSSCKAWREDPSTDAGQVSYSYGPAPFENCYEVVSKELVQELIASVK